MRKAAWLILLMYALAAGAQTDQQALLPVTLNATERGEYLVVIHGDDVLVPLAFFDKVALHTDAATKQNIEGEIYVSLNSMRPGLTFALDPDALQLGITVDPKMLSKQVVESRSAVLDSGRGDPSFFLNYALSGQNLRSSTLFTEIGASRDNRNLYSAFSRNADGFLRGLTNYNIDTPARLQRTIVGDAVIGPDPLGGTIIMGGLTVQRQFSLQPYFVRAPALDLTGTALTPSTVEVYVNGQLTNRFTVQPGPFSILDVAAVGGLGNTRVVVRDVYGREVVQEGSYYYSTSALRKGLSDYTFSAGMIRSNLTRSFDYDQAAAYGFYRLGVTDSLTLGGRLEASQHVVSGGPRATISGRFGDIDLSTAVSSASGESGTAGSIAYRFNASRYGFGLAGEFRSDQYATLSLTPQADRVVSDWSAFATRSIGMIGVGIAASGTDTRARQNIQRVALQSSAPLGRFGTLFASLGSVTRLGKREPEILFGFSFGLGAGTTADVQLARSNGVDGVRAQVQRPLGTANGFGYSLTSDSTTDRQLASLEYQTSFGRYSVEADPSRLGGADYSISGGVVSIGDRVLLSRPTQDSFALARVGVPNVRIFSSNQEVGRTNSSGDLLITNLLGHYANHLSISDQDVPIDYEIDQTLVDVVPPSRGGVIARFPVRRLRSYTGTMKLMIIGMPYIPSLGIVEVQRHSRTTQLPLGHNGEFYTDDLEPGTFPAELQIGKIRCKFNLVVPLSSSAVTDLGVLTCTP